MDPPTLDGAATTTAQTRAHLAVLTHALARLRHIHGECARAYTYNVGTRTYTLVDRRHFSRQCRETHTAEGMKTAGGTVGAHTAGHYLEQQTSLKTRREGVARELPPVHLPVLLPAATPRAPVSPARTPTHAHAYTRTHTPLSLSLPLVAFQFLVIRPPPRRPKLSLAFLDARREQRRVQPAHA